MKQPQHRFSSENNSEISRIGSRRPRLIAVTRMAIVLGLTLLLLVSLVGCSSKKSETKTTPKKSPTERTVEVPIAPKQDTPENAVTSYLEWISYAYGLANSDEASMTMTPEELVRVDSYVQLNKGKMQVIDQKLDSITIVSTTLNDTGDQAIVVTNESWTYSYISMNDGKVDGPNKVSYDVSYTVKLVDGKWLVDSADAKATTGVE